MRFFLLFLLMSFNLFAITKEEEALMSAAATGNLNGVMKYIGLVKNVDAEDRYGYTALFWACLNGHYDSAWALIQNNADVNHESTAGKTPLMFASQNGHTDIVKLLIENQARTNEIDSEGFSPLLLASQFGHEAVVSELLLRKADPNVQNLEGKSALMYASEVGDMRIVEMLIGAGANVNLVDKEGNNAMHYATSTHAKTFMFKHLYESGLSYQPNELKNYHVLPDPDANMIMETLIANGIEFDKPNANKKTPLRMAIEYRDQDAVRILLSYGAVLDENLKKYLLGVINYE